ncbi:MAG: Gfo/Idh/MocA family oxidoreductase, partial [Oscillospiraceae bacterium]|nr:Gfo/Idh/MocA family oxidoreductase [Oscillospiraceae bacterium]
MNKVVVGLVGSGFSAILHAEAYQKVYGLEVVLKAVASVEPTINDFANKYGITDIYSDYNEMLKDPEIDVIDICTPPVLHIPMVKASMTAGKHVICEKPLTGFFGEKGAEDVGHNVKKSDMLKAVVDEMDDLAEFLKGTDKLFMYAENFVYAPAMQKNLELLKAKKSKILYMRGEESHCGSHAHHAAYWKYNGGGSFIRQGCHPLSAAIYLKQEEAALRGEEFGIASVMGDVGVVQSCLPEE